MRSGEPFGLQERIPLAPYSTLRVGGVARWFLRADSIAAVAAAHRWCSDRRVPLFVLGGGSNLVIADEGIEALVVQVALAGIRFSSRGDMTFVDVAAGESWDGFVSLAISRGLAGIECLSGIPGTVGGTPIQNVGAYGQEVAETIDSVSVFDFSAARMSSLTTGECGFAYRLSRFKTSDAGRFLVCGVRFRLQQCAATATYPDVVEYLGHAGITTPTVADVRQAVLTIRRRKGMVIDDSDSDTRSVGSFFMNPIVSIDRRDALAAAGGGAVPAFPVSSERVKIPAAWLIERAGFAKGFVDGAVGISTKHPLALVNRGGATARDVVRLATRIKRQVVDRFGVSLRPEPIFVGFEESAELHYLQKADA